MTNSPDRILWHGTKRKRAEAILKDGPNPYFVEPGGMIPEKAFSAAPAEGPFPVGTPELYARSKANLFPNEDGPVVLEVSVPAAVVELADETGGEFRFGLAGTGLNELIAVWPSLPKRILEL
jgi:hypothetical protein